MTDALHAACSHGLADASMTDAALHAACSHGLADTVRELLATGADADAEDEEGLTPLLYACMEGHVDCASLLLENRADVNKAEAADGYTPLVAACQEGSRFLACASLLLDHRADVNLATSMGITPLHNCCMIGEVEFMRLLLEHGARVDVAEANGVTALAAACHQGDLECAQLLSSYGATRSFTSIGPNLNAEIACKELGHHEMCAWFAKSRGWHPLHHLEVLTADRARSLLRAGADPHQPPDACCGVLVEGSVLVENPAAPAVAGGADGKMTPAERAAKMPGGAASELVLRAARPWGRANHALYPDAARARAVELLCLGQQLSSQPRFAGEAQAVVDLWIECVMPHVVRRGGLAQEQAEVAEVSRREGVRQQASRARATARALHERGLLGVGDEGSSSLPSTSRRVGGKRRAAARVGWSR